MLHSRVCAAIAAVAAIYSSPARADDTLRRIGVVTATVINVSEERAAELSHALGEEIKAALPVEVIDGDESQRRLPEGGVPEDCLSRPECSTDIGRRLDADELLYLAIVAVGDSTKIEATWVRVANADTRSRPGLTLEASDDVSARFAAVVADFLPHISPRSDEPAVAPAPAPTVVVVSDKRDPGPQRQMTTTSWILAGAGGACILGGGVFAFSTWNKYSKLDRRCSREACDKGDVRSLERQALAADILLGVGLAAGAASAILYYTSEKPAAEKPPPISFAPTPGGGQLVLGGHF